MANELTINLNAYIANGQYKEAFTKQIAVTQNTLGAASGIHIVTTSEGNLSLGDVATGGYTILQNLDDTNYITFGLDDAGTMKACMKLEPGEFAMFRLKPSTNLRMLANVASCKVYYWVLND